jgi:hypothetical protein
MQKIPLGKSNLEISRLALGTWQVSGWTTSNENEFKKVLLKSKELKNSFVKFMLSINKTITDTFSIMRYAFLIPIISDDIMETLIGGSDIETATTLIVKRLLAYGAITFSSEVLSNLIEGILKKLSK